MRVAVLVVCAAVLSALLAVVGGKLALVIVADSKARRIVSELAVDDQSLDAMAVELTRQVHIWYQQNHIVEEPPLLWRLRPYLTHELIPSVFRLPVGAIDTLYVEGMCDAAARTLAYILKAAGIEGSQLNIVNRFTGAHTVVLARFSDGRETMLDPLYGVLPKHNGELLSPGRAFEIAATIGGVWQELSPHTRLRFYQHPEHAVFAEQNAGLEIEAPVHLEAGGELVLGRADGDSHDVHVDGWMHNLTHLWTYLGHKHDRGWVRIFTFAQDTRVEIGLTEPVNAGFITTDIAPRIEGNKLVYEVPAGKSLRFVDGYAKRDWARLKSYQDIDYIRFEPIS